MMIAGSSYKYLPDLGKWGKKVITYSQSIYTKKLELWNYLLTYGHYLTTKNVRNILCD